MTLLSRITHAVGSKALTPPLPVASELAALVAFVVDGADDVVEDGVKAFAVAATWRAVTRAPLRALTRRDLAVLAALLAIVAYLAVNDAADHAGDLAESARNAAVAWLRLPWAPTGTVRDAPLVSDDAYAALTPARRALVDAARVLDDATEDAFKALCVYAHWRVGSLLRDSLVGSGGGGARVVGVAFALGVPASQYSLCNDYGDMLGDVVQIVLTYPVLDAMPRDARGAA